MSYVFNSTDQLVATYRHNAEQQRSLQRRWSVLAERYETRDALTAYERRNVESAVRANGGILAVRMSARCAAERAFVWEQATAMAAGLVTAQTAPTA